MRLKVVNGMKEIQPELTTGHMKKMPGKQRLIVREVSNGQEGKMTSIRKAFHPFHFYPCFIHSQLETYQRTPVVCENEIQVYLAISYSGLCT